jgi:tetratricopeptide (TPR) repeat protein
MTPILLTLIALGGSPDYWALRAEQFAVQEEWIAAIENADEAVRLDHANPQRYLDRAYIKLRARRYAEALGDANRAELAYRRFGIQTMAPPYVRGEAYRLSAMDAADLNEANVLLGVAGFELQRMEEEAAAPGPAPQETEEEQQQAQRERLVSLTARLRELEAQREQARLLWEQLSASNESLKQAQENYSIAIGRLPASPHPYAGRKLAEEAFQANQAVLDKAEQILEKADSLYDSVSSSLRGLSDLPSRTSP